MSSKLKPIIKSPHGEDLTRILSPNGYCTGCYFNACGGCTTMLYHKEVSALKGPWFCEKKVFGKTMHFIYIEV